VAGSRTPLADPSQSPPEGADTSPETRKHSKFFSLVLTIAIDYGEHEFAKFTERSRRLGVMARIRITPVMDGPGPRERIIAISTKGGGQEEVILPKELIQDDTLEVGKVATADGSVLIELPQESASGSWRLWIDAKTLVV
jgi:hypothetical protein